MVNRLAWGSQEEGDEKLADRTVIDAYAKIPLEYCVYRSSFKIMNMRFFFYLLVH